MTIDGRTLKKLAAEVTDDAIVHIHPIGTVDLLEARRAYVVTAENQDEVPTSTDGIAPNVGDVVIAG